jgi:hypothetical protein
MGELAKDREKLSIDLADRAATIRKLLNDNEDLRNKLEAAQVAAKEMLEVEHANTRTAGGMNASELEDGMIFTTPPPGRDSSLRTTQKYGIY